MAIVEIRESDTHERMVSKLNSNFLDLRKRPLSSSQSTIVIEQTNVASRKYIDASLVGVKEELSEDFSAKVDALFDLIYPVGSIVVTLRQSDSRLSRGEWAKLKNSLVFNSIGTKTSGTVEKFYVKKSVTDDEKNSYTEVDAVTVYMYRRVK